MSTEERAAESAVDAHPARSAGPVGVAEDEVPSTRSRGVATDRSVPWLDRPVWHMLRLDPIGLGLGVVFALISYTPSLIPRGFLFQGLASGISAAIGYGFGVTVMWLISRTDRWDHASERYDRVAPTWVTPNAWRALVIASPLALLVMLLVGAHWQRQLAALMGVPPPTTPGWLRAGPVMVVVFVVLLSIARGVRLEATIVARWLRRWGHLPRALSAVVATVLVLVAFGVLVNTIVLRGALSLTDDVFSNRNAETYVGDASPRLPTRSGSPSSLVAWDSLGREGRAFVAHARPPEQLAAASGRPATAPVRAYVGLATSTDPQVRARLAVAELDRQGAFARPVVAVFTTTGTGWVDENAADALELMYGGNTAIVASQYSYLPSWLSFLVDRSRAAADARAMIGAVHQRIQALPPDRRPRLLVYGESLGSQGSETSFSSLAEVRSTADGAFWEGPPNSNPLWSSLVARREPGTSEVSPIVGQGRHVRFGADSADLARPSPVWDAPRVAYVQHASDPIVWWSPSLLWRRPDWLAEPRGRDVLPTMSWYPVVTFWQVTIDMTNALSVPDGHGHNYRAEAFDGWAAIAAPAGWTDADTTRAQGILGG